MCLNAGRSLCQHSYPAPFWKGASGNEAATASENLKITNLLSLEIRESHGHCWVVVTVGVQQSGISLHDLDDRVSLSLSDTELVLAASWRLGSVSELPARSHTYMSTGRGPETVVDLAGSCLI